MLEMNNPEDIIWQQDGAPPHCGLVVMALLNARFGNFWIGRDGPIQWPPRSPDLTICDFFIGGTLKNWFYATEPRTLDELRQAIVTSWWRFTQQMCENACRSVSTRLKICLVRNGSQVSTIKYR
jgi:hypothetical protein